MSISYLNNCSDWSDAIVSDQFTRFETDKGFSHLALPMAKYWYSCTLHDMNDPDKIALTITVYGLIVIGGKEELEVTN